MDPQEDFQTKIFRETAKRSPLIIRLFLIPYSFILIVIAISAFFYFSDKNSQVLIYDLGKNMGRAAIILLGVVVLPGILGRFKIEIRLTRIITLFRRQLGILVFLLVLSHLLFVRFIPTMSNGIFPFSNLALFELFGLAAFLILFLMFLTSNNLSQKGLGSWWKKLHRFVYAALWLLVLHTGFQRISIFSIYVGIFAILEVVSWGYYWISKSKSEIRSTKPEIN